MLCGADFSAVDTVDGSFVGSDTSSSVSMEVKGNPDVVLQQHAALGAGDVDGVMQDNVL